MPFRTHAGQNVSELDIDSHPQVGAVPGTRVVSTQNIRIYARLSDVFIYGEEQGTQWLQIGAIQSLRCAQSRPNDVLRGIGYGVNVDIAPSITSYTLSATRLLTYNRTILEALGYTETTLPNLVGVSQGAGPFYGLRSLAQLSVPLEIRKAIAVQKYQNSSGVEFVEAAESTNNPMTDSTMLNEPLQSVTVYRGCFVKSYGHSVVVGGTTITETADFACTRIEQ